MDEFVCEEYESQLFIGCVHLKFYIVLNACQGNNGRWLTDDIYTL